MTKLEATQVVTQVCKDYRRKQPDVLQWHVSKTRHSSSGHWQPYSTRTWGHARQYKAKIHITAGYGGGDHLETLLHELAHHIIGKTRVGRRAGHPVRFWRLHYELCERYGVTTPDHARNVHYRAKAADARKRELVGDGLDSLRELLVLE